ncbi:unnamed protein product [Pseudo-nitzschia multistriata]|uniref:N-acetyltransferase domain-containing protein n=1 Tax=Pseudo-nitzschia multistriata TaxID=183589 RepID=A0A448YYX0_9STRA|nr:unnamed protein product [Pseudo-nitzschia multistriata]
MLFQLLLALAASKISSSLLRIGTDGFRLRPYLSSSDEEALADICKGVWNGTDYLPATAQAFEEDPSCDFVVLEHETTGAVIAAGNRRRLPRRDGNRTENAVFWLEAVRVAPEFEGRGIATALTRELCRRCREEGAREILSCTVKTNRGMTAVFGKEGIDMHPVGTACIPDFGALSGLPGWSSRNDDKASPENILKAMGLEDSVDEAVRSDIWEPVRSEEELTDILEKRDSGESLAYMPQLGKLLWSSDDLVESIREGLVRKLKGGAGNPPVAVFALVRDSTIQSLRSKYVCSVVASSPQGLDSALWEACNPEYLPLIDGNPAFSFVFEMPLPSGPKPSVAESLPLKTGNAFSYYRWAKRTTR